MKPLSHSPSSSATFQPYPSIELFPVPSTHYKVLKELYKKACWDKNFIKELRRAKEKEGSLLLVGFHSLPRNDLESLLLLLNYTPKSQDPQWLLDPKTFLCFNLHLMWQAKLLEEFANKSEEPLVKLIQEAEHLNLSTITFQNNQWSWVPFSNSVKAIQHWKKAQQLSPSSSEVKCQSSIEETIHSGRQHILSSCTRHSSNKSMSFTASAPNVEGFIYQGLTTTAVTSSKPLHTGSSSSSVQAQHSSQEWSSSGTHPYESSLNPFLEQFSEWEYPLHLPGSTPLPTMTESLPTSSLYPPTAITSSNFLELSFQQNQETWTKPTIPTTMNLFPSLEHPPCLAHQQHQRPHRSWSPHTPLSPSPVHN